MQPPNIVNKIDYNIDIVFSGIYDAVNLVKNIMITQLPSSIRKEI